jgi:hypothetical protein
MSWRVVGDVEIALRATPIACKQAIAATRAINRRIYGRADLSRKWRQVRHGEGKEGERGRVSRLEADLLAESLVQSGGTGRSPVLRSVVLNEARGRGRRPQDAALEPPHFGPDVAGPAASCSLRSPGPAASLWAGPSIAARRSIGNWKSAIGNAPRVVTLKSRFARPR